jgi:hypothetical protein
LTSIAIIDTLKTFEGPIIELDTSNIHGRDKPHRHSKISSVVRSVICRLGPDRYIVAMQGPRRCWMPSPNMPPPMQRGTLSNLPFDIGRWFAAASPPAAHCGTGMAAQPQQADNPPAQSIVSSVPQADMCLRTPNEVRWKHGTAGAPS